MIFFFLVDDVKHIIITLLYQIITKRDLMSLNIIFFPALLIVINVFLVLADPPGAPYIEGYTPGETLRRGQTIELYCRSRGGNPPAQVIWYKNGAQIRMAYK